MVTGILGTVRYSYGRRAIGICHWEWMDGPGSGWMSLAATEAFVAQWHDDLPFFLSFYLSFSPLLCTYLPSYLSSYLSPGGRRGCNCVHAQQQQRRNARPLAPSSHPSIAIQPASQPTGRLEDRHVLYSTQMESDPEKQTHKKQKAKSTKSKEIQNSRKPRVAIVSDLQLDGWLACLCLSLCLCFGGLDGLDGLDGFDGR